MSDTDDNGYNAFQLFLKLEMGSNVVRIISKPHQYQCHADKVKKGNPSYGQKLWCLQKHNGMCKICEGYLYNFPDYNEEAATYRWIVAVIDRKTNSVKYLDLGLKAFSYIQLLYRDKRWGDPENYDIDVNVDEYKTHEIRIIALPPIALTQADLLLKEHTDLGYLEYLTNPTTINAVSEGCKYETVKYWRYE